MWIKILIKNIVFQIRKKGIGLTVQYSIKSVSDVLTLLILNIKGTNCETDIDECSSDPCENGATCIDLINMYECSCDDGYTGN